MNEFRPPAVPLLVFDLYFSIWSFNDKLYDDSTRNWTGAKNAMTGIVRCGNKVWRFMGKIADREYYYCEPDIIEQVNLKVNPTTTEYTFENVKYTSEQEYFYVRYNRYLAAYMESEDYDEIDEKNVRFAKTLLTMSTTIKKINFFWIGEEVNGQFVASIPVMEIVYDNGTCDIAIIKDISPESLGSAVT